MSSQDNVREQLTFYKRLFEDGLILEAEYDQMRKQILDNFMKAPKNDMTLGSPNYPKNISENVRLLVRLPQSGKTEIMLNGIVDFIQESRKPLVIVICDNSLLLTTQTLSRGSEKVNIKVGKITCDANGFCEWKKSRGELDRPENLEEGHRLSERIQDGEVNTIIVCSNKSRWSDVKQLIEEYSIDFDIQLWIDEADKTVGGIDSIGPASRNKIENLNKWKAEIHSINLITATPFTPKCKWKDVKWIGTQLGGVIELVKIPGITGKNYHHLRDSNWIEQDDSFGEVEDYAESYLKNNAPGSGEIWLIPGETSQQSHELIKNMCLKYFDYVIILNGNTKTITQQSSEILIYNLKERECILLPRKKEVSKWLAEFYKSHQCSEKKIAITGNLCISRGITISSPTCQISHLIFGCKGSPREEEQLMSRVCGYCYSDIIPTVVCSQKSWENVSMYQDAIIKLSQLALSEDTEERILDEEKLTAIIQSCGKTVNNIHISEPLHPDTDIQTYILEGRGFKNAGIIVRDVCGGNLGKDGYMYPKRKITGHECNVPGDTILTEKVYKNRFMKRGMGSFINRRPHEYNGQSFMIYPVYKNPEADPGDFKYFVHTLIV